MSESKVKQDLQNYIKMAQNGYMPLFFDEWIRNHEFQEKMTYKKANENIKLAFKKLARHKSFEKKKTALISMEENERMELISSFVKVVELNTLKENKVLQ